VQLGWLDTNIFIHSLFPADSQYARCQEILRALDADLAEGWLDVLILHELTYNLLRLRLLADRRDAAAYIQGILRHDNIRADDKLALVDAVGRWGDHGVGFADVWLAALAARRSLPICSVNEHDFPADLDNTFRTANLEEEEGK
jgi:predicted nucleic acid-binding protein